MQLGLGVKVKMLGVNLVGSNLLGGETVVILVNSANRPFYGYRGHFAIHYSIIAI